MAFESNINKQESYAVTLRQTNPEKMKAIEENVNEFLKTGPLLEGEHLNEKEVAMVANLLANRMHRRLAEDAEIPQEEMNKAIENALYEGVGERLKLKESGLRDADLA